jgi:hypothetical protein
MKLKFLTWSLMVTTLVFFSCGDDSKEPSPQNFNKEDFYGTWEQDGSQNSGCTAVIKIEAAKFYFGSKCGNDFTYDNGSTYTFEDNEFKLSVNLSYMRFKILSRTTTTFKTTRYVETANMGEYNYTKL